MAYLIDVRTVFLTFAVFAFAVAISMIVVGFSRKTYPGYNYWTFAVISLDVGIGLVGYQGTLPDILSIIIGNSLVFLSVILLYDGLRIFVAVAPRRLFHTIAFVVWLGPFVYFTYADRSVRARTELLLSVMLVYSIWIMTFYWLKVRRQYGGNWLLPIGMVTQFILTASRLVVTILFDENSTRSLVSDEVQGYFLLVTFASSFFLAIGLIFLNSQKTEAALTAMTDEIRTLRGVVPICASCKRFRDDAGRWNSLESYIEQHTEAQLSHGLCPDCMQRLYPEVVRRSAGN